MYFVYALYNKEADKIYIGQTADLDKRLFEHNSKEGNHFTAKVKGVWKLVRKEEYTDRTSAIKRERQLKSYQGRKFIKKLIH
jgi:putative endonuclease